MKRIVTGVLAVAGVAIVVAAIAAAKAPSNGRLVVASPALNVGAATSIHLTSILAPDAYRTTIYVPAGYRAPGGVGTIGNNVGKAHVFVSQSDGSRLSLNGQLSMVNASQFPDTSCTTSSKRHRAVWVLKATQTGGTASVTFPVFVDDHVSRPGLPASASYSLQYCTGGRGLNVTEVDLDLVRMFVNPAARGLYMWRAVYDPATPDGAGIVPAASTLVASAVPVSTHVSLKAASAAGTRRVTLSGSVLAARAALAGVKVRIFVGRSSRLALNRPRAIVRTAADGSYRITLTLAKGVWYARAKAATSYLDITPGGGCDTADSDKLSAKGCMDATLAPFLVVSKPLKRIVN